ncbi:NAD(P)-binding protein [Backusella circina FSU 941]|nr:NAD(P)-binding protein [Backusella circina FSU 941]
MAFFAKRNFSFEQIPDLSGKIAIVTGSNTGIGRVCALEMARKNCTIILACRNSEKTLAVAKEIQEETGNKNIEFIQLDLMSLKSVKAFTDEFKSRYSNLHILINNAGVMMCPFGLSEDGIETQFATNHVAHFYLTTLLLPELERSAPSRVVNVSSEGHRIPFGKLDLENISDPKKYNRTSQYGKSKTCNILFTRELSKRLEAKGVEVYVNANHPGVVRSELTRHLISTSSIFTKVYNTVFTITTEDGAVTQLYLATSPEVEEKKHKGKYFIPYATLRKSYGVSASEDAPKELWDFTEKLLAEKVPGYEKVAL